MKKIISLLLTAALVFGMSVSVFAAPADESKKPEQNQTSENELEVKGDIGKGAYKVSYASKVAWYVTEDSNREVWNSQKDNKDTTPNKIKNNTKSSAYTVTLKSISTKNNDAKNVAKNLKLYLTGDLAKAPLSGSTNVSNGYSSNKSFSNQLKPGDEWSYGFGGSYTAWLTSTSYAPTYAMTISFDMGK